MHREFVEGVAIIRKVWMHEIKGLKDEINVNMLLFRIFDAMKIWQNAMNFCDFAMILQKLVRILDVRKFSSFRDYI